MDKKRISHIEALKFLKQKLPIDRFEIEFADTPVEALDALLLGEHGVIVPEDLVYYDDEAINYDDIPPITEDDISKGMLTKSLNLRLKTTKEVKDWIQSNNVNMEVLASSLIEDFYKNLKAVK